ncbi:hypothetical protein PN498_03870 [Oscillatoria sp. CS-180]|uniref:hypothetical protein n=1 Tax=Oscillatoria sp. CS-180 TaxID=3021720 RepID=UPI00232F1992|nr:hypothetical protein [Oscillatoria sp. CS-180]MDB9525113.1 hypothetical protein [Oscillatoria sp. CS-180]
MSERLDRIEAQQEANTQAIAAFAEQLTISTQEHDRRMDDHDRRMAEIDRRLARLTQLVERFVGQTLSHEERLSALERGAR